MNLCKTLCELLRQPSNADSIDYFGPKPKRKKLQFRASFTEEVIEPTIIAEYLFGETYALRHYDFVKRRIHLLSALAVLGLFPSYWFLFWDLPVMCISFMFTIPIIMFLLYMFVLCFYLNLLKKLLTKLPILFFLFYTFLASITEFVLTYRYLSDMNYLRSDIVWESFGSVLYLISSPLMYISIAFVVLIDAMPFSILRLKYKRILFTALTLILIISALHLTFTNVFKDSDIQVDLGISSQSGALSFGSIRANALWALAILSTGIFAKSIRDPNQLSVFKSPVSYKIPPVSPVSPV